MRPVHSDHARRGSLIVMATTSKNSRAATNWMGEILIVDDEPDICAAVQDLLQDEGYTTRMASDTDSALAALAERMPSLVLLDIWLRNGEREGIDLLETIGTRFQGLPVVMISGHGSVRTAVDAMNLGAVDFLEKPFDSGLLLHVVKRSLETQHLRRENAALANRTGTTDAIVGTSPAIRALKNAIARVATTNSRVLITGEPGSGKETAARAIHAQSHRRNAPFVVMNAPRTSADRFEEELFGREDESGRILRVGLLEQAHGGTLFVDEVAEMSMDAQSWLLRALQNPSFLRVGGQTPVKVDVRVVASTSVDPETYIRQERLSASLYYRINVVPIRVPSLAERREDIPALAWHCMTQCARALGRPPRPIDEEAEARLQAYNWRGNVRQLRNVIERVLILAPDSEASPVRASMLPDDVLYEHGETGGGFGTDSIMSHPLKAAREQFERQYLSSQLARFGGNITRTAAFVGMERTSLHRKLRLLGISDEAGSKQEAP